VVKSSELIFTLTWTVRLPVVSIPRIVTSVIFVSNDTVGILSTKTSNREATTTVRTLLAMSVLAVSSFACGQTSAATAPDPGKLVYQGAPAWSLTSNGHGVRISYTDGSVENLPWNELISVTLGGAGEDPAKCAGPSYVLDRPMKGTLLIMYNDGAGHIGKRICIPFTAKDAPVAQQ
jgi:hypothetical protein